MWRHFCVVLYAQRCNLKSGYVTRCKKAIIQSDIQSHTRYGDAAISNPTVCVRDTIHGNLALMGDCCRQHRRNFLSWKNFVQKLKNF